jgi:hypothetical protein
MPKKVKVIHDDDEEGAHTESEIEEYKEEDISDDEDRRRHRRRNRQKPEYEGPKLIVDTYMPSSYRSLRACCYCKLVLNQEKWSKLKMCPNCPESCGSTEETTDNFESLIS